MKGVLQKTILLVGCGFLSACVAYTKPQVAASTFTSHQPASQRFTLGIERRAPPEDTFITGDDIISTARMRGVFRHVDYVDRLASPPDLVLRDFSYTTVRMLSEPYLYVLTLGVIPDSCPVFHPISFTLATGRGRVLRHVEQQRRDTIFSGWIAGVVRFSPGWSAIEDKQAHADFVLSQLLEALPHEH